MTEMDFSDVLLRLSGLFCVVRQASRFLQKTSGFEVLSVWKGKQKNGYRKTD